MLPTLAGSYQERRLRRHRTWRDGVV